MKNKPVNLIDFFVSVQDQDYCLVKLNEHFPQFTVGSDLDIFCKDVQAFSKLLLGVANDYIENGYQIKIINNQFDHLHFDIYKDEALIVRFDLYGQLPRYQKLNIKEEFFSILIKESLSKNIKNTKIKIASDVNEQVIRYFEYLEYYEKTPSKKKHLNYIEQQLVSKKDQTQFVNRVHMVTSMSDVPSNDDDDQLKIQRKFVKNGMSISLLKIQYYNLYELQKNTRKVINEVIYSIQKRLNLK